MPSLNSDIDRHLSALGLQSETELEHDSETGEDTYSNCYAEWERSGSVVECLTRDRRPAGSSLTGITVLRSLSLELVQPRKTCPCLTERLLMGRKESKQTKAM